MSTISSPRARKIYGAQDVVVEDNGNTMVSKSWSEEVVYSAVAFRCSDPPPKQSNVAYGLSRLMDVGE